MSAPEKKVEAFVDCFIGKPTEQMVANLTTEMRHFQLGDHHFPLTINHGGVPGNCYICNPLSAYLDYAIDETRNFVSWPPIRFGLIGMIKLFGPLLKATQLDRAVHINNWLFSTNPAPRLNKNSIDEMRRSLVEQFPDHAIIMRSLNDYADAETIAAFTKAGFLLLPSRQIYLFDGKAQGAVSKDMKNDAALLRKTKLTRVANDGFKGADYRRCVELYNMLYLQKYTPLNPHYTANFVKVLHEKRLLELEGFRDAQGVLVAFGGRFQYENTLTQPLLGYDTTRPQKEGLYRLITALAQHDAAQNGLLFNMSAGAAHFKRLRHGVPAIEYSAVYTSHLSRRRDYATRALVRIVTSIGIPLLKRFEL